MYFLRGAFPYRGGGYIAALLPGCLVFFAIYGAAPLIPQNLEWLPRSGDPVQAWLGWLFFRDSPWAFPIGMNPRLGLELGNTIIYTDSNPLLAFVFKILAPILPPDFQYFGWWLLACLMLQSFFGYKLCALYTRSAALSLLGAVLFSLSLPMLLRYSCHFNLCAHFLILAALWLCLARQFHPRLHALAWIALLCAAALIHAYIFVMAGCLWLADLAGRLRSGAISGRFAAACFFISIGAGALACWQAGYFGIGRASSDGGFGLYRMNLISLFDSDGFASFIMPDLPSHAGEDEGFTYLGLGGIAILVCAAATAIRCRLNIFAMLRRHWPLVLALALLALLAASNAIGIGPFEITLPVSQKILNKLQFFRASGRMFWPVFYAVSLLCLVIIFRYWTPRAALALLLLACALQSLDAAALAKAKLAQGQNTFVSAMTSELIHPFWRQAAGKYAKIRGVPIRGQLRWHILAWYALKNGMGIDCMYLSRYNTEKLLALESETRGRLASGRLEPDTIYIVDDETFAKAKLPPDALAARIDDFNVIAPEWRVKNGGGAGGD